MLAASLGLDSSHKHIPVTKTRLKTLVQTPDPAEEKVRRQAGVAETQQALDLRPEK